VAGQSERRGAARRGRDPGDVHGGDHARRAVPIVEEIPVDDFLHGDERIARRLRHPQQIAAAADEDVALAVGARGVEERDVGMDRRHDEDPVAGGERVVDHLPVGAVGEEVGADHPAQRHERHALDAGEQARVNRGTGRVEHAQAAVAHRLREPRRGAVLAERDRRGLDRRDAARADQNVGLDAARRQADEVQPLRAAPHERARRRDRDAEGIVRYRDLLAVGDRGSELVQRTEEDWRHERGL
jgi:hypothetical protein